MSNQNHKQHAAHQKAYLARKQAGLVTVYESQPTDEPCPACSGTGKKHKTVRVYIPKTAKEAPKDLS